MPIKNSGGVNLPQTTLSPTLVSVLYGAPDNHIVSGTAFANWSVDAGSTKSSTGITVKQNGTSEFAQIDISGLAANTTYWAAITLSSKSAGVTGANGLAVEAAGSNGSNFQAVGGGQISLASAVVGTPYYFKIQTDATTGPWRLRIIHIGSSNNETVKFSAFNIFPIPARSSAKMCCIGDREGGFLAQYASVTNRAVMEANADTVNLILLGDHAGTNAYATCDCLQISGTTVSGSDTITVSTADAAIAQIGCGITGSGIPAGATVTDIPSSTTIKISANATASATVTVTLTSYLKLKVATRGGDRYICPGNHDYDGSNETLIDDYFPTALQSNNNSGKYYYSVVLGECEFFFINDNDAASGNSGQELIDNAGGISATQAAFQASTAGQWIVNKIAASTAKWKIMCIHHPVWSSSSTGTGNAANRWAWKNLGIHLVLQAHNHGIERIYKDGIYYVTQAMGGGNHHGWGTRLAETVFRLDNTTQGHTVDFATTYGYFKIHDSTTALIFEFFDSAHQLLDRFKLQQP